MPARPLASGVISFGMVSIPVNLFSASESKAAVSFNLLHGKCKSRLKQQYVCPRDGETVQRSEMVKGYEFAKDQYVSFTDDEIKSMQQEANKLIEIAEFVPISAVDPLYFDGAYYLGPDKGGERAYRLLAAAMTQTGRCALARWAARGKQYLVLLRPLNGALVMQQLLYADEVRGMDEIPLGDPEVRDGELQLAIQLVNQIASDAFHPEAYEDDVRKRMQAAIQAKIDGQEVALAPEPPKAQIIDLMEALRASLAAKAASSAAPKGAASSPEAEDQRAAG